MTLSFYGPNAWTTATQFGLLIQSQKALELQESLGLGVYQVSTITDVKILAGMTYGERQDMTLNVRFAISVDVNTLRIDTAELEVRHEIIPFLSEENVMASSIDNLINVAFRKGQDLSGFGLKVGGKGDYRPPQFDAESLKFEYIDANESYGIDLNGSRFLQKLTFAESQDFTRATTGTFIGSNGQIQTAAIDAPRFTHDPVTREVQGLLIEEARTNLLSYPRQFDNAVWGKTGLVVTPNALTSPDGKMTADKLIPNATTGNHYIYQNTNILAGTEYTATVYVKTAGYNFIRIQAAGNNWATSSRVTVDLTNGSYSEVTAGKFFVEDAGNGWFKISIVNTADLDGTGGILIGPTNSGTGTVNTTGDGVSGVYLWHAQLEEGSFPTSVIPDGGAAQVTRAADEVFKIGGPEYSDQEGTFLLKYSSVSLSSDEARLISIDGGVFIEKEYFQVVINQYSELEFNVSSDFRGQDYGNRQINIGGRGSNPIVVVAYSQQKIRLSGINGEGDVVTVEVDAVPGFLNGSNYIRFLRQRIYGGNYNTGTLESVRYFPTKLTEFEIATLIKGT